MSILQKYIDHYVRRSVFAADHRRLERNDAATEYDAGSSSSSGQEAQPMNPEKVPTHKRSTPADPIGDLKDAVIYNLSNPQTDSANPQPGNLSFGQPSQGPTSGIRPYEQIESGSKAQQDGPQVRFRGFDHPDRIWPDDQTRRRPLKKPYIYDQQYGRQDGQDEDQMYSDVEEAHQSLDANAVSRFSVVAAKRMQKLGILYVDSRLFFSHLLLGALT
jgi:hypothetical protein